MESPTLQDTARITLPRKDRRQLEESLGLTISDAWVAGDVIQFVAQPPVPGRHRHGWFDPATKERWLSDEDCALNDEKPPAHSEE